MNPATTKNKSKMSVRKDKDYRKLQQELTREKEKFDQHISKLQRDLQDCQQQLLDEQSTRLRLAMEVINLPLEFKPYVYGLKVDMELPNGTCKEISEIQIRFLIWRRKFLVIFCVWFRIETIELPVC